MAIELSPVARMGVEAKKASHAIAALSGVQKNALLLALADGLEAQAGTILKANAEDMANARKMGTPQSMLDRLFLDEKGLRGIADDVRAVAALSSPPRLRIAAVTIGVRGHSELAAMPASASASGAFS